MKRLHVGYIGLNQAEDRGVITLTDPESGKILALNLELWDVLNLVMEVQQATPRALQLIDFIINLVDASGSAIDSLVIDECSSGECRARLVVKRGRGSFVLDVSPQHGIALALRLGFPIYATREVWDANAGRSVEIRGLNALSEDPNVKQWIERIKPEDFFGC